jgi:signal peptidase I
MPFAGRSQGIGTLDFALLLVVATAVTGVIWLVDILFFKKRRMRRAEASQRGGPVVAEPILVEYSRSFFPILLLVLLLRSFLFEPFRIPSASMMPTLLEGDFIFVNKFAYGLRLPVINTKILEVGEPVRGDVIVFRLPSDPSVNYIKRVVGLPGDVVEYDESNKRLSINGESISFEALGPYEGSSMMVLGREELGDKEHLLLHMRNRPSLGGTYVVPEGHYFMMGDNRDNSQDSRYPEVRFVPEDRLVGRAVRIWMNWRWPSEGGPLWGRIGKSIQ